MSYLKVSRARQRGETFARALLAKLGAVSLPVPIREIAIAEGCIVKSSVLDSELSGMAFIKDAQKHIVYNAAHHSNRQRFTIAHELGHHIMDETVLRRSVHVDRGTLRRDSLSADGIDKMEIAANAFAASVLMPEELVRTECPDGIDLENDAAVLRMAKAFGVSQAAFTNRILNLSLD
ncbi:MAG: ImmA/IrrE family metallo-endopeptidase [Pseudomonadota bacterium]